MFHVELNRVQLYHNKKVSIYACVDGSKSQLYVHKLVERFSRVVVGHVLWIYSVSFGLWKAKRDWSCHTHFSSDI